MRTTARVKLTTIVVFFVSVGHLHAMDNEPLVEKYMSGMQALRKGLQSGYVVCTGKRTYQEFRTGKIEREQSIDIECFFDGSSIRFDRIEKQMDSKTIITEDGVTTYSPSNRIIVKRNVDQPPVGPQVTAFDVRNLGQMVLEELENGYSIKLLHELLQDSKVAEVREDNGVCKISWVYANPHPRMKAEIRRTIWIDSARGFAPVRMEMLARGGTEDWEKLRPISNAEVSWKEVNGVWIPLACRMNTGYGSLSVALELNWKNINGKIPEEMFAVETMNPGENTAVVDERQGKPVLETVLRKSGPTRGN